MTQEHAKENAARSALDFIREGQIVGLGSGSTSQIFIHLLAERCKEGLKITAVPSSRKSAELASKGGIEIVDINTVPYIDITVDGADEIDPKRRMIKGRGGAHVREKILAASSKEMVVIADETKLVSHLGVGPLPVEILFYGSSLTKQKIESLGWRGDWRMQPDGTLFITENGNLLLDLIFAAPPPDPEKVDETLINIPGVVDTGFFFHFAHRIVIGSENAPTKIW